MKLGWTLAAAIALVGVVVGVVACGDDGGSIEPTVSPPDATMTATVVQGQRTQRHEERITRSAVEGTQAAEDRATRQADDAASEATEEAADATEEAAEATEEAEDLEDDEPGSD